MLKDFLKGTVGEERWSFLSWYKDRFGMIPALKSAQALLRDQGLGVVPNFVTGKPLFLRPGTADQIVYDEVFLSDEYDLALDQPRFIVDAGAHIGLASIYFAGKYPAATIVAIEPEPSNFALLQRNVKEYANIKPVKAGLWRCKSHLRILDDAVATWSFRVIEDPYGDGIPAVGVGDLMREYGAARIDLLKIDIEGAEVEVLTDAQSWLPAVGTLIIELHDRYRPGCAKALADALTDYSYHRAMSGESVVISDIQPPEAMPA